MVDDCLAVLKGDSGAADRQAGFAADAFGFVHAQRGLGLYGFQQRAGTARDDQRRFLRLQFLADRLTRTLYVERVDHAHAADADGARKRFEIHGGGRVALDGQTVGGVVLVAGHTCG